MTPTGGLAPDVKRRRRVAAVIYVVILVAFILLIAWRLVSATG